MTDVLEIISIGGPLSGTIRPPGSKSLTNRALVIGALARGQSRLTGVLESDDTRVMLEAWKQLGVAYSHDPAAHEVAITGCGGVIPAGQADVWLDNSGTSMRFLTAACCLGHGRYRLDGSERMRERPIAPLVDALQRWNADVRCEFDTGCPPVIVAAGGLDGGTLEVAGDISSQYLTGLLMAAPCASEEVRIRVTGTLVSRPYVDMTLAVMRSFGAQVAEDVAGVFRISAGGFTATDYTIEPDASAASYFFAAAAVTGGTVTVSGLSRDSLQGDVRFVDILEQMGANVKWQPDAITVRGGELRGVDVDMNEVSDTAQTLAAIAPLASSPTRIRNVAHMRHKETDRVAALVAELRRAGVQVEEHDDGLTIHPGPTQPATIATYNDHRMAMSFAVLGLVRPGIRIADPGCTAKTYPRFFDDLHQLRQASE